MQLTFGSLFTGIGGFDLGFQRAGMVCKWQVEIDEYANKVLQKNFPGIKRFRDVRTFPESSGCDPVDVICGGFPCQDISSSGKRAGINGDRSGLWSEFSRVVCELRPCIVVVENVPDITVRGIDRVLGQLSEIGYNAEWETIPSAAFGLPQRRFRTFIIAYSHGFGFKRCEKRDSERTFFVRWPHNDGLDMAEYLARNATSGICRVDDGVPNRVDRLRALGNAVVPQVAEWIGRRLVSVFTESQGELQRV